MVSNCDVEQVVSVVQTRFDVGVGASDWNVVLLQMDSEVHRRSADGVGSALWNWNVVLHGGLTGRHMVWFARLWYVTFAMQAEQRRFDVGVGAVDSAVPIAQFAHCVQLSAPGAALNAPSGQAEQMRFDENVGARV